MTEPQPWPGADFELHGLDAYDYDGHHTATERHVVYGALARAEALAAGREDWATVTEWETK